MTIERLAVEDETGELRGQEVSECTRHNSPDLLYCIVFLAILGITGHFLDHWTFWELLASLGITCSMHFHVQDIPFRRSAECESLRVDWGTELRTWLPPSFLSSPPSLLTILTQSPLWPVEVIKCTTAQVSHPVPFLLENLGTSSPIHSMNVEPISTLAKIRTLGQ